MKTFKEFLTLLEDVPPPSPNLPGGGPMGAGPMAGGMGGPPMGGMGAPMGGMGGPPMGGAPMDPMAGGAGGAPEPAMQLQPSTVWEVLSKLLKGKPVDKAPPKKQSGPAPSDMLQGAQPQQPPELSQPQQPGMSPAGPAQPPM